MIGRTIVRRMIRIIITRKTRRRRSIRRITRSRRIIRRRSRIRRRRSRRIRIRRRRRTRIRTIIVLVIIRRRRIKTWRSQTLI